MEVIELITEAEITKVVDLCWGAVNKSKLGPIIKDVEVPEDFDEEAWKREKRDRVSILNMTAYETYRMVLASQLEILTTMKIEVEK